MSETIFFRLLNAPVDGKSADLQARIAACRQGEAGVTDFTIDPDTFCLIPGLPFAYWLPSGLFRIFTDCEEFECESRVARRGPSSGDDFRRVRLWWEVLPSLIGRHAQWIPFAKGGSFSPYYYDFSLVVSWNNERYTFGDFCGRPGRESPKLESSSFFFRFGITYIARSMRGFCARILPEGCAFAHVSPAVFMGEDRTTLAALALLNSGLVDFLLSLSLSRGSENSGQTKAFEVGNIQKMPFPSEGFDQYQDRLALLGGEASTIQRSTFSADETAHLFVLPSLIRHDIGSVVESSALIRTLNEDQRKNIAAISLEVDQLVVRAYGLSEDSAATDVDQDQAMSEPETDVNSSEQDEYDDQDEQEANNDQPILLAQLLVMWLYGAAFGRWDVRLAWALELEAIPADLFDPLPRCSPGALVNTAGLPATRDHIAGEAWLRARKNVLDIPPADLPGARSDASQYPLAVAWDGILVDDAGHPDDLVARLRAVLSLVYAHRADAIYQELVDLLVGGGHDLRPYLRGAFFDFHIKRYSKSRRKAPIYWRLATPSGSYAVWLYYHRTDKDTLYKVLNDYVLPKLQHEQGRLDALLNSGGDAPTAAQRKAAATQARLVEELQTFRDEVARVAPLWDPDRNDGVILNCAPLWRLLPSPRTWQAECRAAWDALCRGDYDWAHLALRLWPERVVPKCRADRSLAIAHGLDEIFWQEQPTGKATPRPVDAATVQALIASRRSVAVERALAELQDAAVAPPKPRAMTNTAAAGKGRQAKPKAAELQMGFVLEE